MAFWLRLALWVILPALPVAAAAQTLFSPGLLSSAHADLDGISNCNKCHAAQSGVSEPLCLGCHENVQASIAQKKGFHGHALSSKARCESCHHEHLGLEGDLLGWGKNKEHFEHASTGYLLKNAHAKVACKTCHNSRLIQEPNVKARGSSFQSKDIWQGLSRACSSCHFDEHRGQEPASCEQCHTEKSFKPAKGFDHSGSAFALIGKHRAVACQNCHKDVPDTSTPKSAFPSPNRFSYTIFKPILHGSCNDCHADKHKGKFGEDCASCHSERGWDVLNAQAKETEFHENARFKLKGAHRDVSCKSCHGPFGKKPAVFRGLSFGKCENCHADAHEGQLARGASSGKHCEDCHTVDGFLPVVFSAADHSHTQFPLQGAHQTVACDKCHVRDSSLLGQVPPATYMAVKQQKRRLNFSAVSFLKGVDHQRCDGCHSNPHGEQFTDRVAQKGCADCHTQTSFKTVSFDHKKEAHFALEGAHAKVSCKECHTARSSAGEVIFEALPKTCESCHRDVHLGQLSAPSGSGQGRCAGCHTTTSFSPARFSHNDSNLSRFPLEGAHANAACAKCHRSVPLPGSHISVTQYKPLQKECESCHADYHAGQLNSAPRTLEARSQAPRHGDRAGCRDCHTQKSWQPSNYPPHDKLNFLLTGGHAEVPCRECHTKNFDEPLRTDCIACHRDSHGGELGTFCQSCHTSRDWSADFDVRAHRMTNFPLRGAHGAIPCQECHPGAYSHNFRGTAATCDNCHHSDYARTATTGVNHAASNFSTSCRNCHDPWQWKRAVFPAHDTCFPINAGAHSSIGCSQCHTSLTGSVANGACATGTATCTECHAHTCDTTAALHVSVANYQCESRACYSCHVDGK